MVLEGLFALLSIQKAMFTVSTHLADIGCGSQAIWVHTS